MAANTDHPIMQVAFSVRRVVLRARYNENETFILVLTFW
jgi:hypothetical protein